MTAGPPELGTHRNRKPSTIRDVAALAGVSKSTASRAVLGQGGVSAANLDRVRHAVEQLDFVPNQIARSMNSSSSAMLGLFLRHTRSPFYAHMAGAFEDNAGEKGYEVMSLASGDQPDEANYRSLMLMADLRTAGIAVVAPNVDPRTIRQAASRVPLVLVGQMGQPSNPGVPYIAPDPSAAEELIAHLARLGHRAITLLSLTQDASPTQWARTSWMREELQRQGLLRDFVLIDPFEDMTGKVAAAHARGATAIMAPSDWVAMDVIAAARRLGLSVPSDLSVTGYDGVPPFDHEVLGLTTYRIPIDEMASSAVTMLDELVRESRVAMGGRLLRGQLIVGASAAAAPDGTDE